MKGKRALMKIELKEITIRDVVAGYVDSQEEGVFGYNGKLDIRPKYQREFVYKDKQREAVIDTVMKNFPLNVMYWIKNNEDKFEVLDGQQRTISIGQYVNKDFSFKQKYFNNLPNDKKEEFLNYKLMVYICEGTDSEKLEWFKTINIAGEKLTNQELRNAVYAGEWLTDAKKYFSKTTCPAYKTANKYLNGSAIRQEYLERALKWITNRDNKEIEDYMAKHQFDNNANELWLYFKSVIDWVKVLFPNYRKEQKGIEWGELYNKYKDLDFNPSELEKKVKNLMQDEDVTNKKGIYEYLLSGKEKFLNIREFDDKIKRKIYEEQNGICKICGNHFEFEEMQGDHIIAWSKGGKTEKDNCQMLCERCNKEKSNKSQTTTSSGGLLYA